LPIDLDGIYSCSREEVPHRASRRAGRVAEDRDPPRRFPPSSEGQNEEPIPVVVRQVGARPVEGMNREPFVELELAVAILFLHDARVLMARLDLLEYACLVASLDAPGGQRCERQ